jgi:hypothetical protein
MINVRDHRVREKRSAEGSSSRAKSCKKRKINLSSVNFDIDYVMSIVNIELKKFNTNFDAKRDQLLKLFSEMKIKKILEKTSDENGTNDELLLEYIFLYFNNKIDVFYKSLSVG